VSIASGLAASMIGFLIGAPGVRRTRGPQMRKLALYPSELQGHIDNQTIFYLNVYWMICQYLYILRNSAGYSNSRELFFYRIFIKDKIPAIYFYSRSNKFN